MREVALDTETTGLNPSEGHRICEIGLVELIDRKPTGRLLHRYINPGRRSDPDAFKTHGLSTRFLRSFPAFEGVKAEILDFIDGATLVIHNAGFDMGFLRHELGFRPDNKVIDTYELATKLYPGGRHSLDAMVTRLQVKVPARKMHGALLDAEILSIVYCQMMQPAKRQQNLFNDAEERSIDLAVKAARRAIFPRRSYAPTPEEEAAHNAMLEGLKDPIWKAAKAPAMSP